MGILLVNDQIWKNRPLYFIMKGEVLILENGYQLARYEV